MKKFSTLFTKQFGHLVAEYAVMVALLSVAVISAVSFFGGNTHKPLMDKNHTVINEARKTEIDQTIVSSEDILPKSFYAISGKDTQ